jgi:hypothetical protein
VGEREIVDDGKLRGPELPPWQLWDAATEAWYETWRRSPQAQVFEDTDWQRLHMLAPLVQLYWLTGGDAKLLAEIRQNEERLGATYTDRQRARMRIVAPELAGDEQPGMASVTHMDDVRARLQGS